MSIYKEKPRLNGLSTRRVTHYMALLAKEGAPPSRPIAPARVERPKRMEREVDYRSPSIPDPWDLPKEQESKQIQPSAEQTIDDAAPVFRIPREYPSEPPIPMDPAPWQEEPLTVAHREQQRENISQPEPYEKGADRGGAYTPQPFNPDKHDFSFWDEPLADVHDEDVPEEMPSPIQPKQEDLLDDFARAMSYFSSEDDFVMTGVGKRTNQQEPDRESEPFQPKMVMSTGQTIIEPAPIQQVIRPRNKQTQTNRPKAQQPPSTHMPTKANTAKSPTNPSMRKGIIIALIVVVVAGLAFAVWFFLLSGRFVKQPLAVSASVVYVDGENMGSVKDGDAILEQLAIACQEVEASVHLPAKPGKEVRIEEQLVDERFIASQDAMQKAVLQASDVEVLATGVYVDGRLVAAVHSQEEVQLLMEEAMAPYRALSGNDREILQVGFAETIEMKPTQASAEDVLETNELKDILLTGTPNTTQATYQVMQGDSLIQIARENNVTLAQLRSVNPTIIGKDMIKTGMELSVAPMQGLLTVQFTERVNDQTQLPYKTVTKTSNKLYTTEKKVEQTGQKGTREVVVERVYIAGVMAKEEVISETVIKAPIDEIIVKGTKKVTKASGTGVYLRPISGGSISSRFGTRWGKQHSGLDIAASTGTPIYASRDGKVTFSGTNGDYGKLIKIDHGSGIETRYAHCSVLKVSSGTYVKQGQLIALVGSTGRSTGPHVHFEVRVNGVAKDPEKYLAK